MNDIHAKIQAEYRMINSEYEMMQRNAKEMLYANYPRIQEIDSEISSLAIKKAKSVLNGEMTPEQAADIVKSEADALRAEKERIMQEHGLTDVLPTYKCQVCNDTGYTHDGRKCGCYMRRLQAMLTLPGERNTQTLMRNSSFENFNLNYYPDEIDPDLGLAPRDVMRMVFANCCTYAADFQGEGSGNLLLCGPSGLGKTLMACSIANEITNRGYLVIYKSSYKLFQFMEDYKFGRLDRDEYSALFDTLYDCDLLVIDDFGTEFITSYTQSVFFDLLSSRLAAEKPIVISTNLSFDKILDIYQERVMSRLQNEFNVLRFVGNDIRAIKNNK